MTAVMKGTTTESWLLLVVPMIAQVLSKARGVLMASGSASLSSVLFIAVRSAVSQDDKKTAYRLLIESTLTWTDEFPSLAVGSGLDSPGTSRGEPRVMAASVGTSWKYLHQDSYPVHMYNGTYAGARDPTDRHAAGQSHT